MVDIKFIPFDEFQRVRAASIDKYSKLSLIADMCRVNTLSAVKRAGSGHLGSSLSAMEIVVWLYEEEMNTKQVGVDSPQRDIYFSSKGHDVPGFYSVLFSHGILPLDKLLSLRRFGGLDGHPDISARGIEANSGSLGMGISKARGMAWAKLALGHQGRVFVMTGDGELQEGQNYEALQTTIHQGITNLTVIVDHNKVQSDKQVCEIVDLGDLVAKFRSFGWHVARCNGNDYHALEKVFCEFRTIHERPKVLVADTLKGCGISFMEHPTALQASKGLYPWHAGAPNDQIFATAHQELVERINDCLSTVGLASLALITPPPPENSLSNATLTIQNALGEPVSLAGSKYFSKVSDEYVAEAYGQALLKIAPQRPDLVVLDADLAADCRVRSFEATYPDRFIQNGIAEQDMVSMAGGLARQGLLPVVNSFASFLASRANEQIYNNASERTKIIYACHYAGLIPAGPGKSHQSLRDISLFGALPNCEILQPCNAYETELVVQYCVNQAKENCVIRLVIGPSPRLIQLPENYKLTPGQGISLTTGSDGIIFAYGPVMLHEALLASEILNEQNFSLKVINMPWLNRLDTEWLADLLNPHQLIFVLDDHAPVGGLHDHLLSALNRSRLLQRRSVQQFAVEGYPACGTPAEALRYHKLDGYSLAQRIYELHDRKH